MTISNFGKTVVEELGQVMATVSDQELDALKQAILSANRIYVAGAGRSLLMIRCLAMRLMQTGFQSYVVGETVTPAIKAGDLLIIASGSGETGSLKIMAQKAVDIGAKLAHITIFPNSTIGKLAHHVVQIPATTSKSSLATDMVSIQPGAGLFEQSLLLLGDSILLSINENCSLDQVNAGLMDLHANLE